MPRKGTQVVIYLSFICFLRAFNHIVPTDSVTDSTENVRVPLLNDIIPPMRNYTEVQDLR